MTFAPRYLAIWIAALDNEELVVARETLRCVSAPA